MEPNPLAVPCPLCGAASGHGCSSRTAPFQARTHKLRWQAVGVTRPTADQRIAADEDAARRNYEDRVALTAAAGAALRQKISHSDRNRGSKDHG